MSTPRAELHALIDSLPEETAAELLPEVRLLKLQTEARTERSRGSGSWPPAWFGSVEGSSTDVSERVDEILRAEFGRRPA
ncbi:hypothetical protein ACQPXM_33480 [Kribbella sp. CA-253562]|uniref:hypothetical protein n=1 Tax=Kribbella sp. CA-253562 TaxID=3239942 RepID=UPI003D94D560